MPALQLSQTGLQGPLGGHPCSPGHKAWVSPVHPILQLQAIGEPKEFRLQLLGKVMPDRFFPPIVATALSFFQATAPAQVAKPSQQNLCFCDLGSLCRN